MHTPGPWRIIKSPRVGWNVVDADRNTPAIARVLNSWEDATLIAAAPDLLEACKAAEANLSALYPKTHFVRFTLRAAIAKAEGGNRDGL